MVYAGGRHEVGKEPASEYCSIGKATEKIVEKNQPPGDPGGPELKTLEWAILNPDRLINLEINNERITSII